MPDTHAMLSASSAHRWLECTPSAKLESTMPDETSPYAQEGTRAHEICEAKLRKFIGEIPFNAPEPEPLDKDMAAHTDAYRDLVEEEFNVLQAESADDVMVLIEQQLKFDDYVPEGFGTADVVLVGDRTLEVIDFKYGKGVYIDAVENPQLRLYALGAYIALSPIYDFEKIRTKVHQPRLNSVTYEELTVQELLDWADAIVKPRAERAYRGEGEYKIGPHCRFCKAGSVCRARAEEAFKVIEQSEAGQPPTLSDDEIEAVLGKLDDTERWINAIREYAQSKAARGERKWRGFKLVEARTQRKISDPIEASLRLERLGFDQEDITNTKLKGITELERLVGKDRFATVLADLIVKPEGAPVLVDMSDKRPAINPISDAFKEEM